MKTSKNIKIPMLMADRFGNISLRSMIALMLEVSYIQASIVEKDIDMGDLRWIVYSWDLDIIHPIDVNDEYEIATITTGIKKFYAYRNFYIKKDGKLLARAYAVFLLLDIEKMRPVKISSELENAYRADDPIYMPDELTYRNDYTNPKTIQVRRTDIDLNLHVNNTYYFDYVSDLLNIDSKDIRYINIVYKNEIRDKDEIIGEYVENGNEIDFRLKSMTDDTIYTYGKVIKNV